METQLSALDQVGPVYQPSSNYATSTGVSGANSATCTQTANDPHVSTYETYNGKPAAKGEIRTTCSFRIDYLYQTAQLWEKRWYGWDRVGTKGVYNNPYPTTIVQTFGRWECRNSTFRVTGYGEATIYGQVYYASTESNHVNLSADCPG
ncbi:MAG: hypothetical protein ACR2FG_07680 [Marmoricola sp.]